MNQGLLRSMLELLWKETSKQIALAKTVVLQEVSRNSTFSVGANSPSKGPTIQNVYIYIYIIIYKYDIYIYKNNFGVERGVVPEGCGEQRA